MCAGCELSEFTCTNGRCVRRDYRCDGHNDCWDNSDELGCSTCEIRQFNATNEWVLNKVGVKRELLDTVKARKIAYHGHAMRKQGSCLENEIMQGTMPGARRRGRPRTAWMDNIKTWTGLPRGRVNQDDIGQRQMEKVRPRSGHPSDRGRLKNRTECHRRAGAHQQMRVVSC